MDLRAWLRPQETTGAVPVPAMQTVRDIPAALIDHEGTDWKKLSVLDQMEAGYVQVQVDQQPYMQGFMPVMQAYLAETVGLSAEQHARQPLAGGLFRARVEVPGLAPRPFAG